MQQPNERAANSMRLEDPCLGFGLDEAEVDAFLDATRKGLVVPETPCDKGIQDDYALRSATTVSLTGAAS